MASNNKKSEYYISINAQQAITTTKALEDKLKALRAAYGQLVAAHKEGSDKAKQMARDMRDLEAVIKQNKVEYELISKVMGNLSGSTLGQLQRALRNVKKEMTHVSEDNGAEILRQKYEAISRQIKVMQGEYVNMKKVLKDLSSTSDATLQKAIEQQKVVLSGISKENSAYESQRAILTSLATEQANRNMATINSGTASAESLRTARKGLVSYRDMLGDGGIMPTTGTVDEKIKEINQMLAVTDERLNAIAGKEKEVELTTEQLAQSAQQMAIDPKRFTPEEIQNKLKAIDARLKTIKGNDPFRAQLNKSAQQLKAALAGLEHEAVDVDDVLKRMKTGKVSFDELERAAKKLESELRLINQNEKDYIAKSKQLQQVRSQIEKNTLSVKQHSSAWQTTLRNMSAYFGAFQLFSMAIQKVQAFFRLNLKFSDQLADIRKVSGLAMSEINDLANSLAKLDTRTTIQELNEIAYAGAKLGMGKYGTAGLEQFVRAANQVNVALKEDLGADALTALSKITEVMGLIPKMGVEKSMLAVGSAMFQLSATSTATSNNIVEFSKRLTGMARTAGITTDQLLALGSASDAMYLMPEVASTAFNKLITSLQTKHNLIEKELQIEPGTINNLYSAGKTMDAIVLIFEKMREKGNMNALQGVFKDLGSEGARLVNVMVTMSKNVDILKDHLYTSEEAFEESTAVTNEYAIQQETANALMERASNIWEKAFVNPQGVDQVKGLAKAWYDFSLALTSSTIYMSQLKGTLWLLVGLFKMFVYLLPLIAQFLMFKGAATAIMGLVTGVRSLYTALVAAKTAQEGLNTAMKANLWGLAISLVSSLIFYLIDYNNKVDEAVDNQKDLNHYIEEGAKLVDNEKRKLDSYLAVLNDTNTSVAERERIIKKFNHEYQPYLTKLGLEVTNVDQLKGAYAALNEEIKKKMYYQMKERAYEDMLGEAAGGVSTSIMDYSKYVNQSGSQWSGFDTKWLQSQVDAGRNTEDIYRNMIEAVYGAGGMWSNYNGDYVIGQGMNTQSISDSKLKSLISRFVSANQNYKTQKTNIDQTFDPIIGDYNPFKDDDPGSLDADALKKAKEEAAAQKKQWRDDLKEAQDQARAIIDNIKNFYQRQINEVLRTANEQNWDTSLTDAAVRAVEGRMNLALSNARKSIAGVQNSWDDFKLTMDKDLKEKADDVGYNESQQLLNSILASDPAAIREMIMQLSSNLELPQNAAIDAIWKNASTNEGNIETAEQKRRKEVQKRLLEDNYTQKVDNEYTQSMETLGFFNLSPEQANILLAGGDEAEALLQRRAKEIGLVLQHARETNLYAIKDKKGLMEALFGKDWESQPTELASVLELTGDELKVFYRELQKYSDDYTEALKRARERQKKILDEQWQKTREYHGNEDAQKRVEIATSGVGQFVQDGGEKMPRKDTYGTASFVSSMGHDPEIDSYRLKMEAAAAYYDFLNAHQADAETLRDAEQAILKSEMEYASAVAEQMKERINDIYEMVDPLEDFGTSIGEAFATMTEDAEEGRKAIKEAIGDMINDFMKQTISMSKEYIKRRLMQKMNDRLTSLSIKKSTKKEVSLEQDKQDQVTNVMEQGGEAQQLLNEDVKGSIQKATTEIGNETLQVQTAQTQQEVQTESAKTQANTVMGISSGASKIIGSLGWWGIPLIAVITALLNGLLSFAMSKVSSLFGGDSSSDSSDSGPNVKLVTGMLTYDSGNVQAFRGIEDGKTYPVVGNDGKVYAAKDGGELSTGLVKDPITTLVNGQPALVAEKGPEMVIGRETTAAMMMARPDLLAEIVKFDKNRSGQTFRAYDAGNVSEVMDGAPSGSPAGNGLTPEDVAALRSSLDGFAAVMTLIQKNGLHVNKYGRGGVAESAASGANFMRRNSGDRLWKG